MKNHFFTALFMEVRILSGDMHTFWQACISWRHAYFLVGMYSLAAQMLSGGHMAWKMEILPKQVLRLLSFNTILGVLCKLHGQKKQYLIIYASLFA